MAALISEALGRIFQTRALFSLDRAIFSPIGNVLDMFANILRVLDSCFADSASSLQTDLVMTLVMSPTSILILTIAQVGFVMSGLRVAA